MRIVDWQSWFKDQGNSRSNRSFDSSGKRNAAQLDWTCRHTWRQCRCDHQVYISDLLCDGRCMFHFGFVYLILVWSFRSLLITFLLEFITVSSKRCNDSVPTEVSNATCYFCWWSSLHHSRPICHSPSWCKHIFSFFKFFNFLVNVFSIFNLQLTKLHQLALQHAPLMPGHNVGGLNPQGVDRKKFID